MILDPNSAEAKAKAKKAALVDENAEGEEGEGGEGEGGEGGEGGESENGGEPDEFADFMLY